MVVVELTVLREALNKPLPSVNHQQSRFFQKSAWRHTITDVFNCLPQFLFLIYRFRETIGALCHQAVIICWNNFFIRWVQSCVLTQPGNISADHNYFKATISCINRFISSRMQHTCVNSARNGKMCENL